MAGDLSDIIDLEITIASAGISRAGFGVPLIAGYHDRTVGDRVETYNKVSDMVDDGFATTDLEYIAASKLKGQETSPKTFKVARLGSVAEGPTQIVHLTPATAVSTRYFFELAISGTGNYQDVDITSSATATSAEILASLTAAVAALVGYSGNLLATTATGKLVITGAAAGKHFAVRAVSSTFSNFTDETADPGVETDLNTILAEDDDWYALLLTYKSDNIISAGSSWISTLRKMYIAATADMEVAQSGSSDIGSVLNLASYTRTVLLFSKDYMAQPDAALAGVWLPYDPGSETLKFKQLTGISTDNLTASQLTQLRAKKVNFYISYAGQGIVSEGTVSEGKFADLIRFVDWLFAEIQQDLFALLVSTPKVPFSPAGITQVEGVIRAVLQRGVNVGGLLPGFTVTVPALEEVSQANREARNLSPVEFSADSAGAIHGVTITGTVSV